MRWGFILSIVAATTLLQSQALAQVPQYKPDPPMEVQSVPGSPIMGQPDPNQPRRLRAYVKCPPGKHRVVYKTWQHGERVKVRRCVPNKSH
jgi:hypothetical protein